ncbi:trehalose-phosphatase [Natrarchaeobius chitinivorans]|uniref:Trehalose 6-phosphate phosphatase n=1 Tax=Natrarchaeobius chitinivorans TaxID=1679083 RepID=A0A3N6LU67_NATCH|nr:trehalose-phosphatase [Natrarchaeobius chitinivorans]RQG93798.1 trehalose-phosphatase [Natrarchaeobius chitinivorans]
MSEEPPPRLDEQLPQIRSRLARASDLLVCLDFDGTLAPIVDEPDEATPLEANERALSELVAEPTVSTAIVSGRSLPDVRNRIDEADAYAGNHGLELARSGAVSVHPIARKRAASIDEVCSALEPVLSPVPGSRIENKRLTATVHTRNVPEPLRPIVHRRTTTILDRFGDDELELSRGKRVLEIGPAIPWGKGNAVELIASGLPDDAATVYVGDDVTDESAFRVVEPAGIGVRVGADDPSAASCRVRSPTDVVSFLQWLGSAGVDLIEQSGRRDETPVDPPRAYPSRGQIDLEYFPKSRDG